MLHYHNTNIFCFVYRVSRKQVKLKEEAVNYKEILKKLRNCETYSKVIFGI